MGFNSAFKGLNTTHLLRLYLTKVSSLGNPTKITRAFLCPQCVQDTHTYTHTHTHTHTHLVSLDLITLLI